MGARLGFTAWGGERAQQWLFFFEKNKKKKKKKKTVDFWCLGCMHRLSLKNAVVG
jgi:hypothetical protein